MVKSDALKSVLLFTSEEDEEEGRRRHPVNNKILVLILFCEELYWLFQLSKLFNHIVTVCGLLQVQHEFLLFVCRIIWKKMFSVSTSKVYYLFIIQLIYILFQMLVFDFEKKGLKKTRLALLQFCLRCDIWLLDYRAHHFQRMIQQAVMFVCSLPHVFLLSAAMEDVYDK